VSCDGATKFKLFQIILFASDFYFQPPTTHDNEHQHHDVVQQSLLHTIEPIIDGADLLHTIEPIMNTLIVFNVLQRSV